MKLKTLLAVSTICSCMLFAALGFVPAEGASSVVPSGAISQDNVPFTGKMLKELIKVHAGFNERIMQAAG